MLNNPPAPAEPRFFFLMPVWGKTYIDYLLTFALPTLLAPNNLPGLPNRAVSQFTFITRAEDEKDIRASKLFARLEALIPIKFIFLDFYQSDRTEKLNQLGVALKLGAGEALGRGYCLFFHPDGLYSDGMLKTLYGVARSGKKACVTHGPNAAIEKIVPYLREQNLLTFDEVNPIPSRVLARALIDNPHPDTTIHCMGNPHYPVDPYMGFWLSPKLDGALFRFVSLHPWLVDLSHLSEIVDFTAIDHNFIRAQGFIWSDVHVETDSDNILVIGLKPENERNAIPNPEITPSPIAYLTRSLRKWSNCNYSRFCFFHGLKVHTGDLDKGWRDFEVANIKWLNTITDASMVATNIFLFSAPIMKFYRRAPISPFQSDTYKYYGRLFVSTLEKFFRYALVERRPLEALKYSFNIFQKLSGMILRPISRPLRRFRRRTPERRFNAPPTKIAPEFCAVCQSDTRRCVSGNMALARSGAHQSVPHRDFGNSLHRPPDAMCDQALGHVAVGEHEDVSMSIQSKLQ